jgi:ribosomal protein L21
VKAGGKQSCVSEEYIASIFKIKEYAEQETSVKAGGKQSSVSEVDIASIFRVEK